MRLFDRVHHVGIAVRDLDAALRWYLAAGATAEGEPYEDRAQDVRVQFVRLGGLRHELVAPLSERSALVRVLDRHKGGVYHVAYELDDFADLDLAVHAAGGRIVSRSAHGWGGMNVAFAAFEVGGALSLCEFVSRPGAAP